MLVKVSKVSALEITEAPNLDPIRVYVENYAPGKGRITISCYTRAWVGYWGAMGNGATIQEFFLRCDPDYLAGNMLCGSGLQQAERHRTYLKRIIVAVQDAFREVSHGA